MAEPLRAGVGPSAPLLAVFGTAEPPGLERPLAVGDLSLTLAPGALRAITFRGVEVVRTIDMPVRDANWATLAATTVAETFDEGTARTVYRREFRVEDLFVGTLECVVTAEGVEATVRLTAERETRVNRAGFTLLHPLSGVVGTPVTVIHSDGSTRAAAFPALISPGQPVFDIAGLEHTVEGISVSISFGGEVFEMEDQRNWTDASYKTYCRPLGAPRPFTVAAGETIEQTIAVAVSGAPTRPATAGRETTGRMPAMTVALDPAISPGGGAAIAPGGGAAIAPAFAATSVRVNGAAPEAAFADAATAGLPADVELIIPEGADPTACAAGAAQEALKLGVHVARVTALPEAYLASIQPEGPWPEPSPGAAAAAVRSAFPDASVGGGVLTNFTEFNRCPPGFDCDFTTFGGTAIVHAADDRSVLQTLEAWPHVLKSAAALSGGRPLRLGLSAIAMRTNPYGATVSPNPGLSRIEMAQVDPRQDGLFAAAFAVGLLAAFAEADVEAAALGMATGPLGFFDAHNAPRPLFHVAAAAARLAGAAATIRTEDNHIIIQTSRGGLAANLSDRPMVVRGPLAILSIAAPTVPEQRAGEVRLQPFEVALTGASASDARTPAS